MYTCTDDPIHNAGTEVRGYRLDSESNRQEEAKWNLTSSTGGYTSVSL